MSVLVDDGDQDEQQHLDQSVIAPNVPRLLGSFRRRDFRARRIARRFSFQPPPEVGSRTIEVLGRSAKVFSVVGPTEPPGSQPERANGSQAHCSTRRPSRCGCTGTAKSSAFDQDRARPDGDALAIGQSDQHDFELTPGTHWMHSHTLSEQQLLAAPMVTREKTAGDLQEVVIMLHDFAFRSRKTSWPSLGARMRTPLTGGKDRRAAARERRCNMDQA